MKTLTEILEIPSSSGTRLRVELHTPGSGPPHGLIVIAYGSGLTDKLSGVSLNGHRTRTSFGDAPPRRGAFLREC